MRRSERFGLVGKKVAALAKNQAEIARVLGLTQQSISARLTERTSWSLTDLTKLSKHFDVPDFYFIMPESIDAEHARSISEIVNGDPELVNIVSALKDMPRRYVMQAMSHIQLVKKAQVVESELMERGAGTDGHRRRSGRAASKD